MTRDEFLNIVKGNDTSYLNADDWIEIKDEEINESIDFIGDITIKDKIEIKDCKFHDFFSISDWIFENYVSIEGCIFDKGIWIEGGEFKKDLDLKWITSTGRFSLTGGVFKRINLSLRNTKKLWISGGTFEEFNFGGLWVGDDRFEELVLINKGKLNGNVRVINKEIKKISLNGGNSQKEFLFQDLRCEYFCINDFTNSGSLKIFGLKPMKTGTTYFEVVKSNLAKAQFFRIGFDQFDEVIIVDSYIAELTIINSQWRNGNFRAVVGPAYLNNIESRAIISSNEREQLRENFRQLKFTYEKQGDKIYEAFFYSLEMNEYNKVLKWTSPLYERFWQKLIIILSRALTNYGSSFLRPLIGILVSNWIILLVLICIYDFYDLRVASPSDNEPAAFKVAVGEYFKLINPLHKMDESLRGWSIMWDILSRILSSYFLFGLIRSSRRFLR